MISQVYFSESIEFFKKGFIDHWGVDEYHNPIQPALFMGVYRDEDIRAINGHAGFRLVRFTGADLPNAAKLLDTDMTVWCLPGEAKLLPESFRKVELQALLKDFSMFKPVPLGDKVYCYLGYGDSLGHFRYDICRKMEKMIPYEIIYGKQGMSLENLKYEYYDRSFINLRLNPMAGGMTAEEMACMGRYSVSNRVEPWYINWRNPQHIADIIIDQAKHIGNTRPSLITGYDNEWRSLDIWK
jgi:hypothetical protein